MLDILKSLNLSQYDCDLVDIRIEETRVVNIAYYQKELHNFNDETKLGAFIRVFHKKKWYYAVTTDIKNLQTEVQKLAEAAKVTVTKAEKAPELKITTCPQSIKDTFAFHKTKEEKIAFLSKLRDVIENDPMALSPYVLWGDKVIKKYYLNSKGVAYHYDWAFTSVMVSYTLKDNENLFRTSFHKTTQDFAGFNNLYDDFLKDLAEAKLFVNAPTIEPGKFPVVLSPKATGMFAHESFGHKSEADFMIGDEAMKAEWEIGKKVASEGVSIVDFGGESNNTGYCPIDDEGNPAQKTYLIKNGILTGRLHNTETAELLSEDLTGNARAINFENEPIVRMTNTYFEAGNLTFDELIKPIEKGYFIKDLTHGSGMSTFTLAVNRAYKIENGKLTDPVKINVATGTVFQTLHDIDGLSDKVEIESMVFGGCGKGGQFPLPVADGGPYIRIKSLNLS